MKTTRMLKLKNISPQFKVKLDNLMREFCAAKRYSYNRLLNGLDQNETNKLLQRVFRLNKRYSEDATLQAKTIIQSQKELLVLYLEETKAKLIKTRRKIETYKTGKKTPRKVDLKTCLEGLEFRVKKLEQKQTELENHIDNHTIPPAIFGGKKNFCARTKGHITNQEWKDLRTNQLYSRGDKTKKGNLKPKHPISAQLIAGIDVNIDRTAVTIMTKQGNFIKSRVLSVHQAAALVIGRRGLGYREKLPVKLIQKLQELKPYLQNLIGSKEESNKIKYLKDIIQKIDNFKHYHLWTLWNMANKFLEFNLSDHKLKRQEVKILSY
ncbi:hypothetical protein [Natranaerofaba carboxydovora]|uniref:hypothetical protein n=1 Tax=Natranaerofaba carboxydovora TaxID=2742683 RepID=UPI001F12D332|nr:hypothetical protein [Natranaerofaba carboxydovora]UMZ74338.1 hypothetical protein ACONDI_01926 [Natranaerofaba carboxydovora]